jgi:hypothetical protein
MSLFLLPGVDFGPDRAPSEGVQFKDRDAAQNRQSRIRSEEGDGIGCAIAPFLEKTDQSTDEEAQGLTGGSEDRW